MRLRLDSEVAGPSSCFQLRFHRLEGPRMQVFGFPGALASALKIASRCRIEDADDPVVADRRDKLDRWQANGQSLPSFWSIHSAVSLSDNF